MKKTFLVLFGVYVSGHLYSSPEETKVFTTSKDHKFIKVNDPRFDKLGPAWRDEDGMIWGSAILTDVFANINDLNHTPDVINGIIQDSPAIRTCTGIGNLPTKADFDRLVNYFEHDIENVLTDKGKKELYQVLPDMENRYFWSSSVYPANSNFAYYFNSMGDSLLLGYNPRDWLGAVLCVGR